MENQTSFIPKKSLAKDAVSSGGANQHFYHACHYHLFLSLLFGVGVYFYKIILVNGIKAIAPLLNAPRKRLSRR